MFELLERVFIRADREVDRMVFDKRYWSANKVNFDPQQMPQRARGIYEGPIHVAKCAIGMSVPMAAKELSESGLAFAEVMEGFHFGVMHEAVLRKYNSILIPGTLGKPDPEGLDVFCPNLFIFGESLSYGIEHLALNRTFNPIIEFGTLCLLIEAR